MDEWVAVPVGAEQLAEQLYLGVLGRAPDPTGLRHLARRFHKEGSGATASAIADMLRSDEFLARWHTQLSPDRKLRAGNGSDILVLDLADREAQRCLGTGWHAAEPSGTWAAGHYSVLQFDPTDWWEDAILFLDVVAAVDAQAQPEQRIGVTVNGVPISQYVVTHRRPCTLICSVPNAVLRNKAGLVVTIDHPDSLIPADQPGGSPDTRDLSIMLREARLERLTPARSAQVALLRAGIAAPMATLPGGDPAASDIDPASVAARFESLGSNCELGFVQRALGHEPLSFLRFAGLPLHKLLRGLRDGFRDLALPGRFHIDANSVQTDWLGRDDLYLLYYHTGQIQATTDPVRLAETETGRLRFLARKLLDDIEDGDKIFVIKDDGGLAPEQVAGLVELLSQRGSATLLWIDQASPGHPAGTVDLVCPGVLRGYIDYYSDLDAGDHTIDHESWRQVLVGAAFLHERMVRSS